MSRKYSCLLMAAILLLCSLVLVHAAERSDETTAYARAAAVLDESGIVRPSATALTEGSGMALAVEMGILTRRGEVQLYEIGPQALQALQAQQRAAEEAAEARLQRSTYLALYDGVMAQSSLTLYAQADNSSDVLRTLAAGKVAMLLDVTDSGWYHIRFGQTSGYVLPDHCRGVRYADYEGSAATRDLIEELLDYAYTWLGTPYAYGGSSYAGTDCSGFTMRCYDYVGFSLSHGARDQYRRATPVTTAQRDVGDLVFFSGPGSGGIEHVGIYLGGGRFIHAGTSTGVVVSSLSSGYFADYYYGAGRLIFE